MNKTVMLTHQGSEIPGRVINLDQARARHGDKADHMVRMLTVGDPLADAVIVEMDALGKEGRRILNAGLADGMESRQRPHVPHLNPRKCPEIAGYSSETGKHRPGMQPYRTSLRPRTDIVRTHWRHGRRVLGCAERSSPHAAYRRAGSETGATHPAPIQQ